MKKKKKKDIRHKKLQLGIDLINGTISNTDIKNIQTILDTDIKDLDKLRKIYIKKILLGKKIISKEKLLSIMKKNNKFNYLDFVNEFGLTRNIKEVSLALIKELPGVKIRKENKDKILYNLKLFIMFFLSMESDGKNIDNFKNSGAEGYFQYKINNYGHKKTDYSSFETALRRVSNFYSGSFNISEDRPNYKQIPDWVKKAWKRSRKKGVVENLSAEQQTILFLCDIFERKNKKGQILKELAKHLKNILFNGNQWSIREIYENYHHTKVKKGSPTYNRVNDKIGYVFKKYGFPKKII